MSHIPHLQKHLCMRDLVDSMKMTQGKKAIIAPEREDLTYGQLCRQIEYVVSFLNSHGLGRNDRIAVVLPNGPEMAVAFLGIIGGATFVPLNPGYQTEEYDYLLSDLRVKALIVPAGTDSPARTVAGLRNIPVIEMTPLLQAGAGLFTLNAGNNTLSHTTEKGFAEPNDVALVLHTSGTTSRSKIVPLSQHNILTSAFYMGSSLQLCSSDRCLNIQPMFHISGLVTPLLSSLLAGGAIACPYVFSEQAFFRWIQELGITWFTAVPAIYSSLSDFAERHSIDTKKHSLRFIRSVSISMPLEMIERLEHIFGVTLIESYGLTEATPIASTPLSPQQRKPGSVGRLIGPDVAIMDSDNTILSSGETGEIVVRGLNVMKGYENNEEANQQAFSGDLFKTGDAGYIVDDYLYLTGRIKEIINRGGQKVSPREVDAVLTGHPGVAEAAVFAIPHSSLNEAVAAAVVPRTNHKISEKELRQYIAERIAFFKVPQHIIIVDSIPKSPTGKIKRSLLFQSFSHLLKTDYVMLETETEVKAGMIWKDLLNTDCIGKNDNFFALGGNSLLGTQVISRMNKEFHITIPLRSFFEMPTVAELAKFIDEVHHVVQNTQISTREISRNYEVGQV